MQLGPENNLILNQIKDRPLQPNVKEPKTQKTKKQFSKNKLPNSSRNNHWNQFQQRRYIKFLKQSGHMFQLSFAQKKLLKINELMSKKVKTRNAPQCHSHHQKMLITHKSINQIIQKYSYLLQNEPMYFKSSKNNIKSINQVKQEYIQQQYASQQPIDQPGRNKQISQPMDNKVVEQCIKQQNEFDHIQYFHFGNTLIS